MGEFSDLSCKGEEEACLASMKIASPIFRNYEGSTCIVRSKSTIRKGDEITDNYGFFYQIHPEEERKETLSKQGPFINYVDLGWGIILSIFSVCFDIPVFFLSWTYLICPFRIPFCINFCHNCCIWMASFLHDLIWCIHSDSLFG